MRQRLAFLALAVPALFGVSGQYIDLSGPWAVSHQDQPEYSRPEFDDRAWDRYSVPRQAPLPQGISWLRRRIEIPAGEKAENYFLTLGSFAEAYEVWIAGRLIGATGELNFNAMRVARARTFALPGDLIEPGKPVTVALRVYISGHRPNRRLNLTAWPDTGPYALTDAVARPRAPEAESFWKRETDGLSSLAGAASCGTLMFVLLIAYFWERERRDLLLVLAYLLVACVRYLSSWATLLLDSPMFLTEIIVGPARPLMLLILLLMVLRPSTPRRFLWMAAASIPLVNRLSINGPLLLEPLLHWGEPQVGSLTARGLLVSIDRGFWPWCIAALAVICVVLYHVREDHGRALRRIDWLSIAAAAAAAFVASIGWFGDVAMDLVGTLLIAFTMTALVLYRLGADRREKSRLAGELDAARTVQQMLLPGTAAAGIDAVYWPAAEVGGDFWHVTELANSAGQLVVVGDVSGKGLKAAMVVSLLSGALRSGTSEDPAEILTQLNRVAVSALRGGFVTCCVVRLDGDGQLTAANAGHPAPYLNGQELDLPPGLPLGLAPDADYDEHTVPFQGSLTLVSDGVIEAENPQRELFGFDRTREISGRSAQEIAEAAKAWGQTDDITVVTVRRNT